MRCHVDPASPAFEGLLRRERGRVYLSRGWTIAAVADELDVSTRTVRDWLSEAYERKLARRRQTAPKRIRTPHSCEGGKIPLEAREVIRTRRATGEKLEVIAADYGVSISTIYYHANVAPKRNKRAAR